MSYEQPVIQAVSSDNPVNINARFTISIVVTDSEMVAAFYVGEIFSGEVSV